MARLRTCLRTRRRGGARGIAVLPALALLLSAGCGPGSEGPRTDPRSARSTAVVEDGPSALPTAEELVRRARGPAVSSAAIRGELRVGPVDGSSSFSSSDMRLLVARSGAVRLEAGALLLVSDGARLGCRGPDGTLQRDSAWRPPRAVGDAPCAWLSPAALVRALLPRDPGAGRQGRRLAVLRGREGPVLLEMEGGGAGTVRLLRRFVFDAAGSRLRAREWLDADGDTALRVEYEASREPGAGLRAVTLLHPDVGLRLRLVLAAWQEEPAMGREEFLLPGG